MSPLPFSPRLRGVSLPSSPIFPIRLSSLGALDSIAASVLVPEGELVHVPEGELDPVAHGASAAAEGTQSQDLTLSDSRQTVEYHASTDNKEKHETVVPGESSADLGNNIQESHDHNEVAQAEVAQAEVAQAHSDLSTNGKGKAVDHEGIPGSEAGQDNNNTESLNSHDVTKKDQGNLAGSTSSVKAKQTRQEKAEIQILEARKKRRDEADMRKWKDYLLYPNDVVSSQQPVTHDVFPPATLGDFRRGYPNFSLRDPYTGREYLSFFCRSAKELSPHNDGGAPNRTRRVLVDREDFLKAAGALGSYLGPIATRFATMAEMKKNTRDNVFPVLPIFGFRAVAVRWPLADPSESTDPESRRRRYEEYLANMAYERGDQSHQDFSKPENMRPVLDVYLRIGKQLFIPPATSKPEIYSQEQHARQGAYNLLGVHGGKSPAPTVTTVLPGMMENWNALSGSEDFQCGMLPPSA